MATYTSLGTRLRRAARDLRDDPPSIGPSIVATLCEEAARLVDRLRPMPLVPLPLTKRQSDLLSFIRGQVAENGFAPSFAEISDHFGYRSLATVHEHLGHLQEKGWIQRHPNMSRGIELVEVVEPEATV